MSPRKKGCDEATIAGRLRKSEQFLESAETIREFADDEQEVADACVTLYVHAGVAAADVICCVALGQHSQGEDHNEAIALLRRVRPGGDDLAKLLSPLLGMKTRAGYSHQRISADDRKRAQRCAQRLVREARDRRVRRSRPSSRKPAPASS